jgi:hypothetical protein
MKSTFDGQQSIHTAPSHLLSISNIDGLKGLLERDGTCSTFCLQKFPSDLFATCLYPYVLMYIFITVTVAYCVIYCGIFELFIPFLDWIAWKN